MPRSLICRPRRGDGAYGAMLLWAVASLVRSSRPYLYHAPSRPPSLMTSICSRVERARHRLKLPSGLILLLIPAHFCASPFHHRTHPALPACRRPRFLSWSTLRNLTSLYTVLELIAQRYQIIGTAGVASFAGSLRGGAPSSVAGMHIDLSKLDAVDLKELGNTFETLPLDSSFPGAYLVCGQAYTHAHIHIHTRTHTHALHSIQ